MGAPEEDGSKISVIFDADTIARRIATLAKSLAETSRPGLLVVPILKGSFIFAADLLRAMHGARLRPLVDFLMLSSYRDATTSSGEVKILRDLELDVRGRDVVIVDDILESGRTLAFAKDLIAGRGAERVRTCVLLDKPGRRAAAIEADFTGFECPDVFVIGYGMDKAAAYRDLPFVGCLETEDGDGARSAG